MRDYVQSWSELPDKTAAERVSGMAFSLLVILDGGVPGLPGFQVIPEPHPDDREWAIGLGNNYYPQSEPNGNDIAGGLHELFYTHAR